MQKRSPEQAWKMVFAVVAVIATAMALYVQLFERRVREEQDRRAAARLGEALAESRLRLKTEILAELRAELAEETAAEKKNGQPLPNAVLRRGESGTGSSLQQVVGPLDSFELRENLDALTRQMEQSDNSLRRDVEELRAEVRRDLGASGKVASLLLAALIPLVANLLFSIWQPRRWRRGEEGAGRDEVRPAS
jgi:NurA-like 5'-3' nuclease